MGMTLSSCLERWDELGTAETETLLGGRAWEGAAGAGGSIKGLRQKSGGK